MIISIIRYGWQNMNLSELTEHTLANEIEAPHEILRK